MLRTFAIAAVAATAMLATPHMPAWGQAPRLADLVKSGYTIGSDGAGGLLLTKENSAFFCKRQQGLVGNSVEAQAKSVSDATCVEIK